MNRTTMSIALGVLSSTLFGSGCAQSISGRGDAEANLIPRNVLSPEHGELSIACTPTSPELCFNAMDDNCNGVIDEGCGFGTGYLQFTIAWGESPADVDLVVTEPSGAKVFEGGRLSPSGLRFERDCPGEGCNGQNLENIYLERASIARGHYTVEIRLAEARGAPLPVHVQLGARIGSHTYRSEVRLLQVDERKVFGFDL